jgi:hypothetical protein
LRHGIGLVAADVIKLAVAGVGLVGLVEERHVEADSEEKNCRLYSSARSTR